MWWGSRQQQQCHQARWSGRAPRWRMSGRHSACEVSGWNNLSRTGNLHKQACRENALDPGLSTAVMLDYLMYSLLSIKSPNNKLINKMDHELMDVQDYSWEPLRWLCIFTSCVMEGLEESVMMQFDWTSLPYWWFNQIRPPFGSPSKQSLCKINFVLILQHRAREETPRWHFAICCNVPCLPVAPLSATIMACNLLVMCEGETFIAWHLGIFYFLFPMCSTGRSDLLQFVSQGQREEFLINVLVLNVDYSFIMVNFIFSILNKDAVYGARSLTKVFEWYTCHIKSNVVHIIIF